MSKRKVLLPTVVAYELEEALSECGSMTEIILEVGDNVYPELNHHFQYDMDQLIYALVRGYEVEPTPEEKVRQYYNDMLSANGETYCDIIATTCELLGIKIEGVNANERK